MINIGLDSLVPVSTLSLSPKTHLDQIDFIIPGKGSVYGRRTLRPVVSNGPAMPPITAGVQTPVVGACGVSEVVLVLMVKAYIVEGQAMDIGLRHE